MQKTDRLIASVLRHALEEQRERLAEIESSAAWRAGGGIADLLASPLRNGPRIVVELLRLFLRRRHRSPDETGAAAFSLPREASTASVLIYGDMRPVGLDIDSCWLSDKTEPLLHCLESRRDVGTLILRRVDLRVVPGLGRHQLRGWRLVWWPRPGDSGSKHLVGYVAGLADEVQDAAR